MYKVELNRVVIHLDISRVRSWTGTDLTRFVEISGNNNMTVTTTPFKTVQDRQETLIPKLTAGVGLNAVRMLKSPALWAAACACHSQSCLLSLRARRSI